MLLIFALLILTACSSAKSDGDFPPPPAGPAALLVAHPWELEAAGFDDDSSGRIEPNENTLLACQQDNTVRFFAEGTGRTDENDERCLTDTASTHFIWQLNLLQNQLTISGTPLKIVELSQQALRLKMDDYLAVPFLVEYKPLD